MAHENFNGFERPLAFEAKRPADPFLLFEGELVLVFAGGKMELVPYSQ